MLRQHAAGCGDFDDIGPHARCFADLLGAFDSTGAGIATVKRPENFRPKAADIGMAADDGQRRTSGDNARAINNARCRSAPQRIAGVLCRARLTHRGETRFHSQRGVFHADNHAPFVWLDRFIAIITARVAGQVDMQVDQAGDDGFGRHVDYHIGHKFLARDRGIGLYRDNPPICNRQHRFADRSSCRVGNDVSGNDDRGFGLSSGRCQQAGGGQQDFLEHATSPKVKGEWGEGAGLASQKRKGPATLSRCGPILLAIRIYQKKS